MRHPLQVDSKDVRYYRVFILSDKYRFSLPVGSSTVLK